MMARVTAFLQNIPEKKNTIDIPKPEYVDSLEQRASLDYLDYNKPVFYPTIKP